jgi:hypothetical protein
MLVISVESQFLENGLIVKKSDCLNIWDNPSEVTMRQWSDMELLLNDAPDWFQNLMKPKNDAENQEDVSTWGEGRWVEYRNILLSIIELFVEKKIAIIDLKNLPLFGQNGEDSLANVSALFRVIIANLYNYRGKAAQTFKHNGRTFMFPATMLDAANKVRTIAPDITFQEATEALQSEAKYSQQNFEGKSLHKDGKMQTSLWILACICREVQYHKITGKVVSIEEVPSETKLWYDLVISRLQFFQDVSLETAMNGCFFLSNSKATSLDTLITSGFLLNQALQQMLAGVPKHQKVRASSVG